MTIPQRRWLWVCLLMLVGVVLRLIAVTQPFVDRWSWREADVGMIAQNFYENGYNLLYPQIDWAGHSPGYVGTEFPLLPFMAALVYKAVGVEDWVGRGLSIAFFAFSVPFFYLLARRIRPDRSAVFATAFYGLIPLSIFAGRSFMPDMASLSLSLVGLYFYTRWLQQPQRLLLMLATALPLTLAVLIKVPAVVFGFPMLWLAFERWRWRLLLKLDLWAMVLLILLPPAIWYHHAYMISKQYYPHHIFGSGGIAVVGLPVYQMIFQRTVENGITAIVALLALAGLLVGWFRRQSRLFDVWVLGLVFFTILAGKGSSRHAWYQLPYVPAMAVMAGWGLHGLMRWLWQRAAWFRPWPVRSGFVAAVLILAGVSSYRAVKPLYDSSAEPLAAAGQAIDEMTDEDAMIVAVDNGDPTVFYYSNRNGWHFLENFGSRPTDAAEAIAELERMRSEGADYLVLPQPHRWWLDHYKAFGDHVRSRYRRTSDTSQYVIYDLRRPGNGLPKPQDSLKVASPPPFSHR